MQLLFAFRNLDVLFYVNHVYEVSMKSRFPYVVCLGYHIGVRVESSEFLLHPLRFLFMQSGGWFAIVGDPKCSYCLCVVI